MFPSETLPEEGVVLNHFGDVEFLQARLNFFKKVAEFEKFADRLAGIRNGESRV